MNAYLNFPDVSGRFDIHAEDFITINCSVVLISSSPIFSLHTSRDNKIYK